MAAVSGIWCLVSGSMSGLTRTASLPQQGRIGRKVERPRPLKLANNRLSQLELSGVEDIMVLMESVHRYGTDGEMIKCLDK